MLFQICKIDAVWTPFSLKDLVSILLWLTQLWNLRVLRGFSMFLEEFMHMLSKLILRFQLTELDSFFQQGSVFSFSGFFPNFNFLLHCLQFQFLIAYSFPVPFWLLAVSRGKKRSCRVPKYCMEKEIVLLCSRILETNGNAWHIVLQLHLLSILKQGNGVSLLLSHS